MLIWRKKGFWVFALLFIMIWACSGIKKMNQLTANANSAFVNNNYQAALASYEQLMAESKEVSGEILCKAGIAAFELEQIDKAIDYLEKAKRKKAIDARGLFSLAMAYQKINNLSKEITNLELCFDLKDDGFKAPVTEMLFNAYVRSENWMPADSIWNFLNPQQQENSLLQTDYLKVKRNLHQTEQAEALARKLLKGDSKNLEALDFLAEFHFKRADELYVREMKAYEQNKTMKQYRKFTDALKQVNNDYKTARNYFETLYKLSPSKRYARYLGNIYTRFDNKQRANYWYKLAEE